MRHPVVLRPVLAYPEIAAMPEIAAQADPREMAFEAD